MTHTSCSTSMSLAPSAQNSVDLRQPDEWRGSASGYSNGVRNDHDVHLWHAVMQHLDDGGAWVQGSGSVLATRNLHLLAPSQPGEQGALAGLNDPRVDRVDVVQVRPD